MATVSRFMLLDRRFLTIFAAGFFVLISSLWLAFPAQAAVFNPGCIGGIGNTADLIAAISTSNGNGQADTINLGAACVYTLAAQLSITADGGNTVTINGNGATLNGNGVTRILLINTGADVALNTVTITNGSATTGGGIQVGDAELTITNGIFTNNTATTASTNGGGAIRVFDSTLTITGGGFANNQAMVLGGAILATNTTLSITSSVFASNESGSNGGAIYVNTGSTTVDRSTFSENDSNFGGGIINIGSTLTVTNSSFSANTAGSGAGINTGGAATVVTNSTFSGNSATITGGGISNSNTITVTNSTFSGNSAGTNGAGVHNSGSFSMTLNNTVVANSVSGGDCFRFGGTINAQHSLIEDSLACVNGTNTNNLTGVDPALGGLTGNPAYFPIGTNSPAINKGSNALIPVGTTTDQRGAGFPRIQGTAVDMGSYERTCVSFPVTIGASATDDLFFAVNCAAAAPSDDTINLRPSVYTLKGTPLGIGGAGTLTLNGNEATLDADGLSTVMSLSGVSFINDLTITGGSAITGGGVAVPGTATLRDSTVTGNAAQFAGGIVINTGGFLTLINSTVSGNTATDAASVGGGIGAIGTLYVYDSTIVNNSAVTGGGITGQVQTLYNSIIANNTGGDCQTVTDAKFNLVETACTGVVNGVNGNMTGFDPMLSPLTGSPAHHRPLPGSLAINAGSNALIPMGVTQDQAGAARIQDTTVDKGSIETTPATLMVTLTLQGRPGGPSTSKVMVSHVQIRNVGSTTFSFAQDYTSDINGQFPISNLVAGTYDIRIKGTHTLAVIHTVTIAAGANTLTTSLLREGDADDSNTIILTDFSLLAAAFGTSTGNPGFNPQADFNGDGQVQLIDFSLLASNFNQAGAP